MKFNYGLEKKKFDENWARTEKEYREAGMAEEAIRAMYEYDWEMFKKERVYCRHNQSLDGQLCRNDQDFSVTEANEENSPYLYKFFDRFSVPEVITDPDRTDAWIDEIDSRSLLKAIRKLTEEEQDLIRLYMIEEYTTIEIAALKSISQPAVTKRIQRLREKIKKLPPVRLKTQG